LNSLPREDIMITPSLPCAIAEAKLSLLTGLSKNVAIEANTPSMKDLIVSFSDTGFSSQVKNRV
jgi:hypothetical protein